VTGRNQTLRHRRTTKQTCPGIMFPQKSQGRSLSGVWHAIPN